MSVRELMERYISLYGEEPCAEGVLAGIEAALNITLPQGFKQISKFYSGGMLGGISHYSIADSSDDYSILNETLKLRHAIELSNEYVVIAEPPGSIIYMNVVRKPEVIWCDAVEARSVNTGFFSGAVDTWETYEEFFDYLLEREVQERL
ncbi:SMI1/KNR4 family protein [Pseudomonas sp. CC120222-01a]|uniref:SMI1/KNR4 family protein n=1 Tax=Pseudomonas sp. CC120222-01a TaxID=1378075 RepID=UPI001057AFC3|nr:SMI1/KNR4 family protein [Pseudomonas sp. CC120222-01a]